MCERCRCHFIWAVSPRLTNGGKTCELAKHLLGRYSSIVDGEFFKLRACDVRYACIRLEEWTKPRIVGGEQLTEVSRVGRGCVARTTPKMTIALRNPS